VSTKPGEDVLGELVALGVVERRPTATGTEVPPLGLTQWARRQLGRPPAGPRRHQQTTVFYVGVAGTPYDPEALKAFGRPGTRRALEAAASRRRRPARRDAAARGEGAARAGASPPSGTPPGWLTHRQLLPR
jgi:hypothetical protein